MATPAVQKQKCQFWDKCFRKNKQHREEYLHPSDVQEDDSKMDTESTGSSSAGDKPRLVHDISNAEDDIPAWKNAVVGQKRKASPTPSSSTSSTSPSKKVKIDESKEVKITVEYGKPKSKPSENNDTTSDGPNALTTATGAAPQTATATTSPAPPPIMYKAKREKCKYWDKCYQTGEAHLKQFYHPSDSDDVQSDDKTGTATRGNANTPLNPLKDGGTVEFDSGYKLKRDGDNYSCSCKGFLVQKAPINERTCKHLKEYNGEEFEKARVARNAKPKVVSIKQHINVSLLLAHKYDEKSNNPIDWWISEKLDGVRAYWNGRCFYSRLGNAFYAPEWFTKDLPKDMGLDGELFGGRGQFQSTVSIVKTAESPKWKDIKYYVFDAPDMGKETFENRMYKIKDYFENHQPKYAVFVEQTKCTSKEQLDQKLTRILNIGGEGLMIRQPKSVYERTRSKTLLKIKKFYDAEAIVIGHEKGKGVNQYRCGALRCRMACGKEFSVGSGLTDKDRNKPPKIGTIITYKFQELSKGGSPRFPTYVGIRIDMTEPKDAEIRPVLDEDEA